MRIELSNEFKSKYKKTKRKNVRLKNAIDKTLKVFAKNPNDKSLHNEEVDEPYEGCRKINILHPTSNNYRAIYEDCMEGNDNYAYFRIFGIDRELFNLNEKEKRATKK